MILKDLLTDKPSAWKTFISEKSGLVYWCLKRAAGVRGFSMERETAHEIYQESWVEFKASLPKYKGYSSIETYLRTVTWRTANKIISRKIKEKYFETSVHMEEENVLHSLPDDRAGQIIQETENKLTLGFMGKKIFPLLSAKERVFVSLWLGGMEDKQIANAMGIKETSVRAIRSKTLSKIKSALNSSS